MKQKTLDLADLNASKQNSHFLLKMYQNTGRSCTLMEGVGRVHNSLNIGGGQTKRNTHKLSHPFCVKTNHFSLKKLSHLGRICLPPSLSHSHSLSLSNTLSLAVSSVTRLDDLLHFGQLFKACGNNYSNRPHSQAIFVKVSKSFIFLVKSFLGNFYRHLTTFYWSHWLSPTYLEL